MPRFTMSEEDYCDRSENNGGMCLACGAEADGVEPDARRYECEACGQFKVYGLEELLMMGVIEFADC